MTDDTFGVRFAGASSMSARLALEAEKAMPPAFPEVEALLARIIRRAMTGERVGRVVATGSSGDEQSIEPTFELDGTDSRALDEHLTVRAQEARGHWMIPASPTVYVGWIQLTHWLQHNPALAVSLATPEYAPVQLAGSPFAVALWCVQPLFDALARPLRLVNGDELGRGDEELSEEWLEIEGFYRDLGIDLVVLEPFRATAAWIRTPRDELADHRTRLADAWHAASDEAPARFRTFAIGRLVERYYGFARGGAAKQSRVLNRAYARTFASYFGGDWLAFLDFLGEQPHKSEHITTALPKRKVIAPTNAKVTAVAGATGTPVDEINRMLSAGLGQATPESPVERRRQALRRLWDELGDAYGRQTASRGANEAVRNEHVERRARTSDSGGSHVPIVAGFPNALRCELRDLWGTRCDPRHPDRLITAPAPLAAAVEALGPVADVWLELVTTALAICDQQASTDYARQAFDSTFAQRRRDELAAIEAPLPDAAIAELRDATDGIGTSHLGPSDLPVLMEVVLRHRRAWRERHLDAYIEQRSEADLRAIAELMDRLTAQRGGKEPTLKQFAKGSVTVVNRWFAGRFCDAYASLRREARAEPVYERQLPDDVHALCLRVFLKLAFGRVPVVPPEWSLDADLRARWQYLQNLANHSVEYLQQYEALGAPPPLDLHDGGWFGQHHGLLADTPQAARDIYIATVLDAARA